MASKIINTGELSAIPLVFEIFSAADGRQLLTDRLLENLSTSGAGDFVDVSALSYLIHEAIQTALFINSQEYDIEAASAALLAAQSGA